MRCLKSQTTKRSIFLYMGAAWISPRGRAFLPFEKERATKKGAPLSLFPLLNFFRKNEMQNSKTTQRYKTDAASKGGGAINLSSSEGSISKNVPSGDASPRTTGSSKDFKEQLPLMTSGQPKYKENIDKSPGRVAAGTTNLNKFDPYPCCIVRLSMKKNNVFVNLTNFKGGTILKFSAGLIKKKKNKKRITFNS